MSETAPFDPGIGSLVIDFGSFINEIYSQLMNLRQISSKRMKFRQVNSKIYQAMENNAGFYKGCLLWAYYLKNNETKKPLTITGNLFSNLSKEQLEEYDYTMQINFFENYFESYERDTLYYIGRKTEIPAEWKKITALYKEFLELNKGFINTKTSEDIVLPDALNITCSVSEAKELINRTVNMKDLKILASAEI